MTVNILVECPALIASVKVGVLNCLKLLEEENKCNVKFVETLHIKAKHIRWCDILITVRGCEYSTLKIVKAAKKNGRLVLYYLDDDLLNVPIGTSCPQWYLNQVVQKNLKEIMSYSDALWGVNDKIKEKYLQYCGGKKWITNKVPISISKTIFNKNNRDNKVKFLYAGSVSHEDIVQKILSPVIRDISNNYFDKVDFTFLGSNSGIENSSNVHNLNIIENYDEYRNFVENGNFNVGLAVVETDEFYQCKYYNKFLEYTSVGCVGIYTDSKPYTYVIKNGNNGILCENTYTGWYNAIESLINNLDIREKCFINALNYVKTEHDYDKIRNDLIKDFPLFTTYKAKKINRFKFIMFSSIVDFYIIRSKEILSEYHGIQGIRIIIFKGFKFIYKKLGGKFV